MDPFGQKLGSAFATYRLNDARLVREVRLLLSGRREVLFRDHAEDGLGLARGLSDAVDLLLRTYFDTSPEAKGLALLALGGYGRGELSPHSDVDLLVLHPDGSDERARDLTGPFLAFLWDVGHVVGHSSRTIEQCRETMDVDLPSATAMLEGRLVAGSRALFRQYVEEVTDPWLAGHADEFIDAKLVEAKKRHEFYGGSPLLSVPNVKESAGGLRDMHVAGWVGLALSRRKDFTVFREAGLLTEERSAELVSGYSAVHRVRHSLHRIAKGKQDVLDFAVRPEVAAALDFEDGEGFSAPERFMREYYRSALVLNRFLSRVIRFRQGCPMQSRRRIGSALVEVGGEIYPAQAGAVRTPGQALEAVTVLAREACDPSPDLLDALAVAAGGVDGSARSDPDLAGRFLDILREPGAGRALRALDHAGFLGEYVPEYGRLACLARADPAHQYTVDEHTLRAVEAIDSFCGECHPLREEMLRVARPDLLRLGVLLHDVGKSRGRDHVARGAAMVPEVTRRLGLSEEEARLVLVLVAGHLVITGLADRRVPAEAAEALAEKVPDRGILRSLFLLTLADVSATGHRSLTGWREAQIRRLYESALDRLETQKVEPFASRVLAEAGEGREAEVSRHLEGMGPRYALEADPARAVLHLDLLRRLEDEPAALACLPAPAHAEVWVGARDARGLFARIAGVLTVNDLDIGSAQAYTRADGVALDGFFVTRAGEAPPVEAGFWKTVANDLVRAVEDAETLEAKLDSFRNRFRPSEPEGPPGRPPGVSASNQISKRYTAVEVTARDRPCLLHDLAAAVTRRDHSIHHAIIATGGSVVLDTFYVTRSDGSQLTEEDIEPLLFDLEEIVLTKG